MSPDLFVPMLREGNDEAALAAAVALARPERGHVLALITVQQPLPIASDVAYLPSDLTRQIVDDARTVALAFAEVTGKRLASDEVSSEVRVTENLYLWSDQVITQHARHADLSVIGADKSLGAAFADTFNALLMHSGRPVLVVPRESIVHTPIRHAVVGWQPSREAARTLHDVLPWLESGARIDLVMIEPLPVEREPKREPGTDIATHLARRGFKVNVVVQAREGRSTGLCLLDYVRLSGAELLVIGGYGHARWREAVLGGTTRTVLQEMLWPVFFSH